MTVKMLRFVCIGMLYLVLGCNATGTWCYEEEECDPSTWPEHFESCGGNSQSPINIVTSQVQVNPNLGPIQISSSSFPSSFVITNTGHTVEVVLSSQHVLSGAGLEDDYLLAAFHLHFGSSPFAGVGSEHVINGQAYPLEIHFVFYNTKYDNLSDAREQPDGLAVVGVHFEIGYENYVLNGLISALPEVAHKGQSTTLAIDLREMIPRSVVSYYKYQGSLTTPPCSENVSWHVIRTPAQLSQAQYEAITSLYRTESDADEQIGLVNNFRPFQPLNGRTVYKY
ncbi:carbonic anhydrase 7-like [Anomaloglossus baeobatrachus]|uniref:carbonic anhydrase 7-like n=1 Tax=Anomaloglossus baeobatrachus TaxID=238106 RepID=UPI003F4F4857